jgi:hypothetical protein
VTGEIRWWRTRWTWRELPAIAGALVYLGLAIIVEQIGVCYDDLHHLSRRRALSAQQARATESAVA